MSLHRNVVGLVYDAPDAVTWRPADAVEDDQYGGKESRSHRRDASMVFCSRTLR